MESQEQQTNRKQTQHAFWTAFHRLQWEMHKHAMESLERIQLTMPQHVVLSILAALGGRGTMCDLIERSFQSGPTLTRIVDRLVAADFVTRERDETDRRLVYIALTDAGDAKRAAAEALGIADICRLTDELNEADLAHLNQTMQHLLVRMEAVRAATHQPCEVSA